jgi:hypothetical protein
VTNKNNKKIFSMLKKILFLFLLLITLNVVYTKLTVAQEDQETTNSFLWNYEEKSSSFAEKAGLIPEGNQRPTQIISNVIKIILSLLGIIFLILIIISGFEWMTSGGDSSKVTAAKKRLINAVIGLAIILCSYIIFVFVMNFINGALGKTEITNTNTLPPEPW